MKKAIAITRVNKKELSVSSGKFLFIVFSFHFCV